jgi:hypothetical protein
MHVSVETIFAFEPWRCAGSRGKEAMARRVCPFSIVKRQNQFLVRKGRSILSKHSRFLDAEDAALRIWLGQKKSHEKDYLEDEHFFERGADFPY